MKWILTSLLLCFCATTIAQNTTTSEKEKTATYAPFAWYKEQVESKEKEDKFPIGNNLNELRETLEQFPQVMSKPKIVVGGSMPVYAPLETEVAPMPVMPVDTTITQYIKVYPTKEK